MEAITLETVQWASLNDIDAVEPINDGDAAALDEIRQILLRHNKIERFGVCLLHKHFDVRENEIAIEYTDEKNRISKIVVEAKGCLNMNSIQTTWKFTADTNVSMGTQCIGRCAPGGTTHRTAHQKVSV